MKIKAQVSSIWAKLCILMTVCVCYRTWHDYPWENHRILFCYYYYYLQHNSHFHRNYYPPIGSNTHRTLHRYMMRLGYTVKTAQLLKIEEQMSSKGYMLMTVCVCVCVCVLSDLTWLPILGGGRRSWYIIILNVQVRVTFRASSAEPNTKGTFPGL